jgi:hypothetical protein
MDPQERSAEASYFQDACVHVGEYVYRLSSADGRAFQSAGNYWHGPGDPSTWLSVAIFLEARRRVAAAGDAVALELAAQALGITVERLRGNIEWHEQYMRWHDGDEDYRVL